ncbi:MAG: urease accessory protein UreE, partial [Alphaproteobacteria bacterium]|nr:urease accessory protein UreE [Alphaproteobacteria bacterium]
MRRANRTVPPDAMKLVEPKYTITLTRADRYRRRVAWQADCGERFLLDLAEATYLADGSGLVLDDGDVIAVRAAAEPLMQVTAGDPTVLARIAWHIGNRHTPAEITPGKLFIQPDHVLRAMVQGLGGEVADVEQPFEPEGGAYGGHGSLENSHSYEHGESGARKHLHADGHGHSHSHSHSHGHS